MTKKRKEDPKTHIRLRLRPEDVELIRKAAKKRDAPVSAMIRAAIFQYLGLAA